MTQTRSSSRVVRAALLLTGAVVLGACSSIRVSSHVQPDFSLGDYESFAWRFEESEEPLSQLDRSIRAAVEQELTKRGLRSTERRDADLLVQHDTDVDVRLRVNDPYFEYHASEEYEVGTITVELREAQSGELVWQGSGESELRLSAVPLSPFSTELTRTDEERDWRVDRKIAAILEDLEGSR